MAIRRTSNNSINNAVKLSTGFASAAIPNTPTIGTATAISDVAATVEYTAAVLGATASTFTATSNPGSVTGTGSSPITVTGLTASTAYTFTVTAGNANGTSAASLASNSITTSAPLGSYESIATVSVGTNNPTDVTFSSIPSDFTHLQVRCITRCSGSDSSWVSFWIQLNSDTGSNYTYHQLRGTGASISSSGTSTAETRSLLGYMPSNGYTSGMFGAFNIDILDYKNTNKYKTIRSLGGFDTNNTGSEVGTLGMQSGLWLSTSAITSIKLFPTPSRSLIQYSHFALYGIKGA